MSNQVSTSVKEGAEKVRCREEVREGVGDGCACFRGFGRDFSVGGGPHGKMLTQKHETTKAREKVKGAHVTLPVGQVHLSRQTSCATRCQAVQQLSRAMQCDATGGRGRERRLLT